MATELLSTPTRRSHSQQVIADARAMVENTPPSSATYSSGRLRTPGTARALQDLRSSIGLNHFPAPGTRSVHTAPAGTSVQLTPLSALGQSSKRRQLLVSLATEVRDLAQATGAPAATPILDNAEAQQEDDATALHGLIEQVRAVNQQLRQDNAVTSNAVTSVQSELKEAKDEAAQAKLQCLAADKKNRALAEELAGSKQEVARLHEAVEEAGKVLEQAVEIAMQEGFEQARQVQADLEERMRLMRADRQLYSDQLQALREQGLRERHAAAANAALATARPNGADAKSGTGALDAAERDAEKVQPLRDEVAQLQESLRVAKDQLWEEQEARQVAEAGLLGAKSGVRKLQEAKERAERQVDELKAELEQHTQSTNTTAAPAECGDISAASQELASVQARLAKTEEDLRGVLDARAEMEAQFQAEIRDADMRNGETELQAAAAMQRLATAHEQLAFMEQRIVQQQEQLREEVGLRQAADDAVQELIDQMQAVTQMQDEMQEFADEQAGQLEQMQAAYAYTEAAAEAERSAREAAEKRLQAFAAMQQAERQERARREARYAEAEHIYEQQQLLHRQQQHRRQQQWRQQQRSHNQTWHASEQGHAEVATDGWPGFLTPQRPQDGSDAGNDTPGSAAAAFSPDLRRQATAAGFLPDEYLNPEMAAASMDAASIDEAALMAMLGQLPWQKQQRPESVGKADIEEIVASEEEGGDEQEQQPQQPQQQELREQRAPTVDQFAEQMPADEIHDADVAKPQTNPPPDPQQHEAMISPLVTASLAEEMATLHQSVSEPAADGSGSEQREGQEVDGDGAGGNGSRPGSALLRMLRPRPLSATMGR